MSLKARFAAFFGAVTLVWASVHWYLAAQLVLPLGLTGDGAVLSWAMFAVSFSAPFAAFATPRFPPRPLVRATAWVGFTAMGFSSIALVLAALAHLVRAVVGFDGERPLALAVLVGSGVLTAWGLWSAPRRRVVRVRLPLADLPAALEGLRIVQVTDLHLSATLDRRFATSVVADVQSLRPDLIAVTGDLADGLPSLLAEATAPLAGLRAPLGIFFVTGNHDDFFDRAGWLRTIGDLEWTVLENAHRVVEHRGAKLVVAGVPDGTVLTPHAHPERALAGVPAGAFRLLLAHQPHVAFAAARAGAQLQLSGHTHGGQYFPYTVLVRLFQRFVAGRYRVGGMWLYVSRGAGYWGPPLRVLAPAEVTLLELTRA